MANGEFYSASDTQEACALLSRYGEQASVLAGGTDLMVAVNQRRMPLETVVFIGKTGLGYIKCEQDTLRIGATTTHAQIARSPIVREQAPLLSEAAKSIGSPAIRNMGTIGGNLANASPGADRSVSLLALGAKVKLESVRGKRIVDLDAFFVDRGKTVLEPDELLKAFHEHYGAQCGFCTPGMLLAAKACSTETHHPPLKKSKRPYPATFAGAEDRATREVALDPRRGNSLLHPPRRVAHPIQGRREKGQTHRRAGPFGNRS